MGGVEKVRRESRESEHRKQDRLNIRLGMLLHRGLSLDDRTSRLKVQLSGSLESCVGAQKIRKKTSERFSTL